MGTNPLIPTWWRACKLSWRKLSWRNTKQNAAVSIFAGAVCLLFCASPVRAERQQQGRLRIQLCAD